MSQISRSPVTGKVKDFEARAIRSIQNTANSVTLTTTMSERSDHLLVINAFDDRGIDGEDTKVVYFLAEAARKIAEAIIGELISGGGGGGGSSTCTTTVTTTTSTSGGKTTTSTTTSTTCTAA